MTTQEEYQRAASVNLSNDQVTRKVSAIKTPVLKKEKWIYIGMIVVLLINLVAMAIVSGWF